MRKFSKICILLAFFGLSVGAVNAQMKIAVLDFRAGAGVGRDDVDGISAIFETYFNPQGFILVERTQIVMNKDFSILF